MSGQGFHVHGPHDDALEHAAQGITRVLQIAIAVTAVALPTQKKSLAYGRFAADAAGAVIGVLAMLHTT